MGQSKMASVVHPPEVSQQAPPGFIVLDSEPNHFLYAAYENVSIFVWHGQATAPAVARLRRATDGLYQDKTEGISNVHIALSNVALPSPEAREAFVRLMKERANRRACLGVVVAGTGFWSSAVRSFITGVRLVSPRAFELGVHGSLEEAAAWLPTPHHNRTNVRLSDANVLRALQAACNQSEDEATQKIHRSI